ncbi:hypothetical protein THAOC_02020, partial [Thalassiosira oceanica]
MVVDVAVRRSWIAVDGYSHRPGRSRDDSCLEDRAPARAQSRWLTDVRQVLHLFGGFLGCIVGGRPGVASLSVMDRHRRIPPPGRYVYVPKTTKRYLGAVEKQPGNKRPPQSTPTAATPCICALNSGFEPPGTPQIQQVYGAMDPLLASTLALMHLAAFAISRGSGKTTWEPTSSSTTTATPCFRAEIVGFEPPGTPQIQQVYGAMDQLLASTLKTCQIENPPTLNPGPHLGIQIAHPPIIGGYE